MIPQVFAVEEMVTEPFPVGSGVGVTVGVGLPVTFTSGAVSFTPGATGYGVVVYPDGFPVWRSDQPVSFSFVQ